MKVLIDIPDNEATFGMKVLKSLSFVKKAKPMTVAAVELWGDLKEANIKAGLEEMQLFKEGKLKTTSAKDFLNEL